LREALNAAEQSTVVGRKIEGDDGKEDDCNYNRMHKISVRPICFLTANLA
jgi:hypothetical protein